MKIVWRFLPDLLGISAGAVAGLWLQRWFFPRRRPILYPVLGLIGLGIILNIRLLAGAVPALWEIGVRGFAYALAAALLAAFPIGWLVQRRLPNEADPLRRKVLQAAVAAPIATMGFGIIGAHFEPRLVERDLVIPGLPPDLNGLKLAQISDIHLSPFLSRRELARAVDLLNGTRADVAFVTGDLITGSRDPLDDCIAELARLKATNGVYGCHGNHEMYIKAEQYATDLGARQGIRFLRHQRTTLRFGAANLNISGIDFQHTRRPPILGATRLIVPNEFNLLLSHTPSVFPAAQTQGWDLVVAGHTHGGQLNLELFGEQLNLVRIFTPYTYGYFTEGRSHLWVSRGLGTVGIPARIGAPPEVVLLRLVRA
jgi:predicted MPP superfamily phosphohydrolase